MHENMEYSKNRKRRKRGKYSCRGGSLRYQNIQQCIVQCSMYNMTMQIRRRAVLPAGRALDFPRQPRKRNE